MWMKECCSFSSVKIVFFCWVFSDFWSDFLFWDFIDLLRISKSIVDNCLDKKLSDSLISFEACWSSSLRLLMALRRSLLRLDEASLFETFGSLKIRNFGYTSSCLQLLRKSMSSFSLFSFYFNFPYFQKSLTVTFPCFCAISLYIIIIFLDSTKLRIVCKNKHPNIYDRKTS